MSSAISILSSVWDWPLTSTSNLLLLSTLKVTTRSFEKDDKKDHTKKQAKKSKKEGKGKSPSSATPASGETPTQSSAVSGTGTPVESEEAAPEGGHAKAKTGHLVGKINNLITTDSSTIQSSFFIITLCEFSVKQHCVPISHAQAFQLVLSCRRSCLYTSFTNFLDGGEFVSEFLTVINY